MFGMDSNDTPIFPFSFCFLFRFDVRLELDVRVMSLCHLALLLGFLVGFEWNAFLF